VAGRLLGPMICGKVHACRFWRVQALIAVLAVNCCAPAALWRICCRMACACCNGKVRKHTHSCAPSLHTRSSADNTLFLLLLNILATLVILHITLQASAHQVVSISSPTPVDLGTLKGRPVQVAAGNAITVVLTDAGECVMVGWPLEWSKACTAGDES
jgi:hypothetical protein